MLFFELVPLGNGSCRGWGDRTRQQVTPRAKVILKLNVEGSAPDTSWGEVWEGVKYSSEL